MEVVKQNIRKKYKKAKFHWLNKKCAERKNINNITIAG